MHPERAIHAIGIYRVPVAYPFLSTLVTSFGPHSIIIDSLLSNPAAPSSSLSLTPPLYISTLPEASCVAPVFSGATLITKSDKWVKFALKLSSPSTPPLQLSVSCITNAPRFLCLENRWLTTQEMPGWAR